MPNDNQIYFIVEEPVTEKLTAHEGERDGSRDTGGGWGAKQPRQSRVDAISQSLTRQRIGVDAGKLKSQMQTLVAAVNDLFDPTKPNPVVEPAHGLHLEEITLSVQVNAKGELSILGTGGEIGGSGGIALKFARPKS